MGRRTIWAEAHHISTSVLTAAEANTQLSPEGPVEEPNHVLAVDLDNCSTAAISGDRPALLELLQRAQDQVERLPHASDDAAAHVDSVCAAAGLRSMDSTGVFGFVLDREVVPEEILLSLSADDIADLYAEIIERAVSQLCSRLIGASRGDTPDGRRA